MNVYSVNGSAIQTNDGTVTSTVYLRANPGFVQIFTWDSASNRAVFAGVVVLNGTGTQQLFRLMSGDVPVSAVNFTTNGFNHTYLMQFGFPMGAVDLRVKSSSPNNYAFIGENNLQTDTGLMYNGMIIAAWEADTRTAYGTIVRNPDQTFQQAGGELIMDVPASQVLATVVLR